MELYTSTSYRVAEKIAKDYSTSFSLSSQLFAESIRKHIYAIYAMARIADEIVDTYDGDDARQVLDDFETHIREQLRAERPFSTNPIVQAFVATAHKYSVTDELIQPFFASMRMDITKTSFNQKEYEDYIYGSAEVIGLMCLKIFTEGDSKSYARLEKGARLLGSAYQKVNFLRDMKADFEERGQCYFPDVSYASFNEIQKQKIEKDIEKDFANAKHAIDSLPPTARRAVRTSYAYYWRVFLLLKAATPEDIRHKRIRLSNPKKLSLLLQQRVSRR